MALAQVALPSSWSFRVPPSWVPLLHAHYRRFVARMDPLTPARAALRLRAEHEHRPCPEQVSPVDASIRRGHSVASHHVAHVIAFPRYPSARRAHWIAPVSDFTFSGQARRTTKPNRVRYLRTGPPPSIAPHAASRQRSYRRFQAGERMPGEDLHLSGWMRVGAHPPACANTRTALTSQLG